jgi:ABC-type antimicrobial peptide transport system permease subunit
MTRVALRGLLGRKLRTALTAVAIVLGVAMVAGTFVLTDSIDNAFNSIFNDVRQGSSVVVSGRPAFSLGNDNGSSETPTFPQSVLAKVRAVPDVDQVEPEVNGEALLIGHDGKAVVYGGAPNLGFSIAHGDTPFNPLTLIAGRWPGQGEVVIDAKTSSKEHFAVGQEIGVQAEGPVQRLRISGLVQFGSTSTLGGATLAGFDLPTAQRLFRKEGRLDEIAISSKPGVTDERLLQEVRRVLPPTAQARSATQQAKEDAKGTDQFITFLRTFLLVFAGVALFVGGFVIANSLSITIAQRTREFATMRTLGATRVQVLGSIAVEALVIGAVASLVGLGLGVLLAKGLFRLFDAVGFTLPNSGLLFESRTAVFALVVGIGTTFVASIRPALRATRVPPIAAVREGAQLPPSRFARLRTPASAVLTVLGFGALVYGLFGSGLSTKALLIWMGVGAVMIFFGVALLAARVARPLATGVHPVATWMVFLLSLLVWPLWTLPFWLLRYGVFGPGAAWRRVLAFVGGAILNPLLLLVTVAMWLRAAVTSWRPEWPLAFPGVLPDRRSNAIARQNARRNPQRTASTAAALMIGLALVTLVAVLASSITSTFRGAVNDLWHNADYAITAQNNFSPIPIDAAKAAARAPVTAAVGNVRVGAAQAFGKRIFATAVDPATRSMFAITWQEGSQSILATLGANGAFVDKNYAKSHHLHVGSVVPLTFTNGDKRRFVVRGVFDPPTGGSPFGPVTISAQAWDRSNPNPRNLYSFIRTRGGQSDANRQALEAQLASFPNAKVQTRQQFIDNQISGLSAVLNILYVLLALSVVVSFFGIVNTMVLTVFERTRELGMLRAIGMTRRQTRRMVRHESVITALIGGVLGIALGIVLGAILIARVETIELSLPGRSLVIFAVLAVIVGIVAAIFPARRAARLNVLEALQYE